MVVSYSLSQAGRCKPRRRTAALLSGAGCCAALLLAVPPACAQTPDSFDEVAALAAAAREQQDVSRAIELYTRAEQLRPDWAEGWWYLTLLQYNGDQYRGAIDAATHLLQLVPTAVPAMVLRGLSEFEVGDSAGSLRDLELALAHGAANDPHNEQIVRYHLALALTRAGRFEDALQQYEIFAVKQWSTPDVLIGLGLAGMHMASLPNDVATPDRDLIQQAGSAGYAFLAGESVQADSQFQQLFLRYPAAPNLHLFYGILLFPHDPSLAAEQFSAEVKVAPGNEPAHALLAYTLMLNGQFREALPEAEHAYGANPGLITAQLALGRSLGENGQLERGTQMLRNVLEREPENLEAHIGLAALLSRAGKREEAYRERMACLALAK